MLPYPPPGDLPNPGIESRSPTLQVDSLLSEPSRKPRPVLRLLEMSEKSVYYHICLSYGFLISKRLELITCAHNAIGQNSKLIKIDVRKRGSVQKEVGNIATGMFVLAFISVNISALSEMIHSHYGWT